MHDTSMKDTVFDSDGCDSEFDSDAEEEELRLYTALYFGETSKNNIESQCIQDNISNNDFKVSPVLTINESISSKIQTGSNFAETGKVLNQSTTENEANCAQTNHELINNKTNLNLIKTKTNCELNTAKTNIELSSAKTNSGLNAAKTNSALNTVKTNSKLNTPKTSSKSISVKKIVKSNTAVKKIVKSNTAKASKKSNLKKLRLNNHKQICVPESNWQKPEPAITLSKNNEGNFNGLLVDGGNLSSNLYLSHLSDGEEMSASIGKRKRNESVCSSIESISGKLPLDSLYCNIDYFEENTLAVIPEASFIGTPSMKSVCDEEESRCNRKKKKNESVSNKYKCITNDTTSTLSSSDEEVCVLPPPPPKPVEMLTIDSYSESLENESEDSIKIIECKNKKVKQVKKGKAIKKRNIEVPKVAKRDKPKIIQLSSGSSDEAERDFIEALNLTNSSLTLNIKSNASRFTKLSSNTSKQRNNKAPVKSSVIFSKERSVTKRTPSCPTWTPEMASFYDSDISDEFQVEEIHAAQTDCPSSWTILSEDFPFRKQARYFNREVRCVRCKEFGHLVQKCPKVPHCLYCGSSSHAYISQCPQNCCLRCGGKVHGYCHLTNNYMTCKDCGAHGHHSSLCPDSWRRFHATTSGSTPILPNPTSKSSKQTPYCYNCAKKGHFGHQCLERNFKKYVLTSTDIFNYDRLDGVGQEDTISTNLESSSVSSTPLPNRKMRRRFEESISDHHSNEQAVESPKVIITRYISLQQKNANILGKKNHIRKEIESRTGTNLQVYYSKNKTKIKVIGTLTGFREVQNMIGVLSGDAPRENYEEFVSAVSKLKGGKHTKLSQCITGEISVPLKKKKKKKSAIMVEKPIFNPANEDLNIFSAEPHFFLQEKSSDIPSNLGPLPFNRYRAIQSLRKLLNRKASLTIPQVMEYLQYFKNNKYTSSVKIELYNARLQILAQHVYIHWKLDTGHECLKKLTNFKRRLQKSKESDINLGMHQKISKVYSQIAFPSKQIFKKMIPLTEEYVRSQEENTPIRNQKVLSFQSEGFGDKKKNLKKVKKKNSLQKKKKGVKKSFVENKKVNTFLKRLFQ